MKKCIKCDQEKEFGEFRKDKSRKDGFHPYCKTCQLSYRRVGDSEVRKKGNQRRAKKYQQTEKGKIAYTKASIKFKETKPENLAASIKRSTRKRIESGKQAAYQKQKCLTDIDYRLGQRLRTRVYRALKGEVKSQRTPDLLSCSIEELRKHLEDLFTEEMTWQNYGEWHVDHIEPVSKFDLTKEEEQRACFHYTNLQPLWAADNLKKSNKYVGNIKTI